MLFTYGDRRQHIRRLLKKCLLVTDPKRSGHTMPWGCMGNTRVSQEAEGLEESDQQLYCSFQGRNRPDRISRFRADWFE